MNGSSTAGAMWLHLALHYTAKRRVWTERERELKRFAEKWDDDGVPFEVILVRIADLRRQLGGAR